MIYLPDTNACIRYLNPAASAVKLRFQSAAPQDIALCDIVKMELYHGAYRSARQASNLALLRHFWRMPERRLVLMTCKLRRLRLPTT